jgi:hypothetical protein
LQALADEYGFVVTDLSAQWLDVSHLDGERRLLQKVDVHAQVIAPQTDA